MFNKLNCGECNACPHDCENCNQKDDCPCEKSFDFCYINTLEDEN